MISGFFARRDSWAELRSFPFDPRDVAAPLLEVGVVRLLGCGLHRWWRGVRRQG